MIKVASAAILNCAAILRAAIALVEIHVRSFTLVTNINMFKQPQPSKFPLLRSLGLLLLKSRGVRLMALSLRANRKRKLIK